MSEETKIVSKNKMSKRMLINATAGIAIALVIFLAMFLPKTAEAKKLEEQLDLGDKYLSELQYEQAEAAYLAVIEIDPKNVDAYLGLADVYIAQGEYDKAVEVLEDALAELSGDAAETVRKKLDEIQAAKAAAEVTSTPEATVIGTPIPEPTAPSTPSLSQSSINPIATAEIGDVVKFGRFLQDIPLGIDLENFANNEANRTSFALNADEIEWYVLDRKEDKVLLFSKYVLDTKPYHKEYTEVTWAQSSIREWLNNTFYNVAFNEEEKNYICKTKLLNSDNEEYGTEGGEATIDNVFLLSIEEAKEYFNYTYDDSSTNGFEEYENSELDKRLIGVVTNYAIQNGSMNYLIEEGSTDCSTVWYLRSMGRSNLCPAIVDPFGYIDTLGELFFSYVDTPDGIRPAIWVDVTEDSNDGDILDLTDGAEESEGKIFHSLKANPENLLSFDELNFLGHSIVDLDIYTVQSLLEENNYRVSSNLDWEDSSETDYVSLYGYPDYVLENEGVGIADISAMQHFTEDYVWLLEYSQFTYNNEMKSPIGVRNINMHDTFGEVLEKIGFSNAYEVEADMEYCFSEYYVPENDTLLEKHWNVFSTMIEYYNRNSGWADGLRIRGNSRGIMYSDEEVYYSFGLTLSDALFEEKNGNRRYSLDLKFEQGENTNGKFILTQYSMRVNEQ